MKARPLARFLSAGVWALIFLIPLFFITWYVIETVYDVPIADATFEFKHFEAALLFPASLVLWLAQGLIQADEAPRLRVSRARDIAVAGPGLRWWLRGSLTGLRIAAITLMIVGLMRPQSVKARNSAMTQGLDIMMTMDLSLSMEAEDVVPSRFLATQQVVDEFISRRPNDRIGAVIFGASAYTLLPLTTDKDALRQVVRDLRLGVISGDGTAIGDGLGTALNRLKTSSAVLDCMEQLHEADAEESSESEPDDDSPIPDRTCGVIILATDGASNRGHISPEQSARFARVMGIRIYSIMMGAPDELGAFATRGTQLETNPDLLRTLSETTGGQYFPVNDRAGLFGSFHQILNALERHDIEDQGKSYGELFAAFVWPAAFLLTFEVLLGGLLLRRWP